MSRKDLLAAGAKSISVVGGYGEGELRPNVAAEEPEPLVSHVDNLATFKKPTPAVYYKGKPLSDRLLIKRLPERESNSAIIIPDSAKGKSDIGMVVAISPFSKLTEYLKAGDVVLIDGYAAVGMWFDFADESGEVSQHLVLQEADIIMRLEECRNEPEPQVQ